MNDESLAHTLARVRIDSHPQWTRSVSPYTLIRRYWNASKADAARAELVALMKRECSERAEGGDTRTLGASQQPSFTSSPARVNSVSTFVAAVRCILAYDVPSLSSFVASDSTFAPSHFRS